MNRTEILAILHRHENLSSESAEKIADELAKLLTRESKEIRVVRAKETR